MPTQNKGPYNPTSTASNQNTAATPYPVTPNAGQDNSNPYTAPNKVPAPAPAPSWTAMPDPYNQRYNPTAPTGGPTPGRPEGPWTSASYQNTSPQPQPTAPTSPTGGPTPYTPATAPSPWTPTPPTQNPWTPPTGQETQTYDNPNDVNGAPWTPANFATQELRDKYTAYMQATLPYQQYMQNNYQYGQDFNEAARRWDTQTQWQQQQDRYNMDLTGRQQTMAEWQQREAANQWASQFGQQQQNDMFSQGLATNQQAIDQAYNEGRLTNEQRSIALNELKQRQDQEYQYYQLGEQLGFSREELQATIANRQQQDALARWQQQQQAQQQTAIQQAQFQQQSLLQQAELEAARQNAILQGTGRAAGIGQNLKWLRRS